MADAVDDLVASTNDTTDAAVDTPTPPPSKPTAIPVVSTSEDEEPVNAAPVITVPTAKPSDSDDAKTDDDTPENDNVSISHKKVIQPLDTPDKKDINELLAEEEAKEAQTTPGATITGGAAGSTGEDEDKPAGAPMASPSTAASGTAPEPEADPGSIAL